MYVRDWVVGKPELGFLFPAFNDRSTDLHGALYYSKNVNDLHDSFMEQLLGCPLPLPAHIKPSVIPHLSFNTLAIGAKQLVVQEALETN